jgi:hypothetical protein
MRLSEIVDSMPASTKVPPSSSTIAEVFIIESLSLIDESERRHEGKVLADILRMCGKNPIYFYIRTKAELEALAEEFEGSRYRYLHLSCHGSDTDIETTLDRISYSDFAKIFNGRLKRKRLFASACSVGNQLFSEIVGASNKGMHSVAGPIEDVRFDHAVALWSAFYVKVFSINARSMNSKQVSEILGTLAALFEVPIHLSTYSEKQAAWKHETIEA